MWYVIGVYFVAIAFIFYKVYKLDVMCSKKDKYDAYRDKTTGLLRATKWKKE